jgi:DNA-directed RNA polymerase subunit RPC12/RpoP
MAMTTYTCSACGQEFDNEDDLKEHLFKDHSTKTEVTEETEDK